MTLTSVARVIDRTGRAIQIERRSDDPVTYSEYPDTYGDPIAAEPVIITIRASVQPASASALSNKAEGVQAESKKVIWTRSALREDDIILDGPNRYRILDVEDWQTDGGYSVGYLGSLGDTQ